MESSDASVSLASEFRMKSGETDSTTTPRNFPCCRIGRLNCMLHCPETRPSTGRLMKKLVQVGAEMDLEVFAVAQVDFALEVEIGYSSWPSASMTPTCSSEPSGGRCVTCSILSSNPRSLCCP